MVNEVFMEGVGNDSGCSKHSRNWAEKYGKVLKYEDKMMNGRRCEICLRDSRPSKLELGAVVVKEKIVTA